MHYERRIGLLQNRLLLHQLNKLRFHDIFIKGALEKGLCICLFLALAQLPNEALCAADVTGTLTLLYGPVTIRKVGGKEMSAEVGYKLSVGEVLSTGEKAGAQLVLTDDSTIELSSGTTLRVNQYAFDPERNRRTAVIKVLAGKARFVVFRARNNESRFKVEAGHASIAAGVADFVADILPGETMVAVLDGSVNVKNKSNVTVGQVTLGSNQTTSVREKNPPSGPGIITHEQRRTYSKDVHNS